MSNPMNQPDSQAGGDLQRKLQADIRRMIQMEYDKPQWHGLIMGDERPEITPQELEDDLSLAISRYVTLDLLPPYAERLATEARIDELKHMDSLTYSFMSLGNDFDYSHRQSAVDTRIAELAATLTGEAKQ